MGDMRSAAKHAAKQKIRYQLMNLIGALLLIAAVALVVLLFFVPQLKAVYGLYVEKLEQLEDFVLELQYWYWWLVPLAVLLLYALRSFYVPVPVAVMCIISAAVLRWYMVYAVNIVGMLLLVAVQYWWGRRMGGGKVQKILARNRSVRAFLEGDSKSKPWLLFLFRAIPSFPENPVSLIYGAMEFDFADYCLISLLGSLPKMVVYTMMGKNIYRPLSFSFLIPMIILCALSGISVIGINMALQKRQGS